MVDSTFIVYFGMKRILMAPAKIAEEKLSMFTIVMIISEITDLAILRVFVIAAT